MLPGTLSAGTAVVVNPGGTGLTNTAGQLSLTANFSVTGSSALTLTGQQAGTYTLPNTAAGTLAATNLAQSWTAVQTLGGSSFPLIIQNTGTATGLYINNTTFGNTLATSFLLNQQSTGIGQIQNNDITALTFDTVGRTIIPSGLSLGIGMTPSNVLDITQSNSGGAWVSILNSNASAAATAGFQATNGGTGQLFMEVLGNSFTPNGVLQPNYSYIEGNQGLSFECANGPILLAVGGSHAEIARFHTNGAFGLGMTPVNILDITKNQNGASQGSIVNSSAGAAAQATWLVGNGTHSGQWSMIGASFTTSGMYRADGAVLTSNGAGGLSLITQVAQPIYFGINNIEAGRFDSATGTLLLGTTSVGMGIGFTPQMTVTGGVNKDAAVFHTAAGGNEPIDVWSQVTAGDSNLVVFWTENTATNRGSIKYSRSGGVVQYNTTSDARLKTNIADAGDAGPLIDALRVRQWDWKDSGIHSDFGFVAQEEFAVYPPAVSVGDNDPDTIHEQWGRDDSKLVPLLVKEIQSLRSRLAGAGIA